jgi:hypothetical protein
MPVNFACPKASPFRATKSELPPFKQEDEGTQKGKNNQQQVFAGGHPPNY